jgi:predicted helicase
MGVKSNRDDWVYNFSLNELRRTLKNAIQFYNSESKRIRENALSEDDLDRDKKKIKWTSDLSHQAFMGTVHSFEPDAVRISFYRPFTKQWSYFDASWNWTRHLIPKYFPTASDSNILIWVTGVGATVPFSCWISDQICSLQQGPAAVQHFPLYIYDSAATDTNGLFHSSSLVDDRRAYAITDAGLQRFEEAYAEVSARITKEDLFYYVYGLLHSEDYRSRYADSLNKELARIPAVKNVEDFKKFAQAGRDLAHWHLNYETVKCHPVNFELSGSIGKLSALKPEQFRVVEMKHPKCKDPETGKSVNDKSTVIYNEYITVTGIPLEAYDYVVNGKPAIDWVMERQAVTTDKDSGITNDANLWATETMNNPRYPLELLQRVITVSLETMKIVNSLPKLEID